MHSPYDKRQLTKDNYDNDEDHKEEDLIKHPQGLADILHAAGDCLSLLANLDNLADHLVDANVAILVSVDGVEALLSLFPLSRTEHVNDVLLRQRVTINGDKRHPEAAGQGFGAADFFQGLDDDRMRRVGVEYFFARNLGGDVANDGSKLVTESAGLADQPHRLGRGNLQVTAGEKHVDTIVNDEVLFQERRAVHGKQCARSFVHEAQEGDFVFRVVNAIRKRTLVVGNADELDKGLFSQQDG